MGEILNIWPSLRHRNFRLFLAGQSISLIGTWISTTAIGWLVYRLTRSAFLLGSVGFATQIPSFLLAPFIGVSIDRLDRRKVLVCTQGALMVQSLLLAYIALSRQPTVLWILWVSLFQGVVTAFDFPARHSFIVEMLDDRRDMGNAIAINSTMFNATRLIGSSLAGLLIVATNEGWCFFLDGISYILVIASLLAIRPNHRVYPAASPSVWDALREGWSFVSGKFSVRTILLLVTVAGLFGIPCSVVIPIFAANVLHGNAQTLGCLMGAMGTGSLISAVFLTLHKNAQGLAKFIPIGSAIFGAGLVGFGLSRSFWISMGTMVAVGFGMMQCISVSNTLIQILAGDERRGRIMCFFTMAYVGMPPFGCLLTGSLAHEWGAPVAVVLLGVVMGAGAVWFACQLPAIGRETRPICQRMGVIPVETFSIIEESEGT